VGVFTVVPLLASLVSVSAAGVAQADPGGAECAPLEVAGFGDPGGAVGRVTLEPRASACFTFTAGAAGLYMVPKAERVERRVTASDGTPVDCPGGSQMTNGICTLPEAGAYTVTLINPDWEATREESVSVVPLGGTRGCAAPVSTRWDQPDPATTTASPLEVDCQPIEAAPGERIRLRAGTRRSGQRSAWIADSTGAGACQRFPSDESGSCVLTGEGPYRVLSRVTYAEHGFPAEYAVKARRLNDPQGCAAVPVRPFGPLEGLEYDSVPCSTFTATQAGVYTVRSLSDEGYVGRVTVYSAAGRTMCETSDEICRLPGDGTYTAVFDSEYPYDSGLKTLIVLDQASGAGCVAAPMGLFEGKLTSPGQFDCLTLDAPRGASVAALTPLESLGKLLAEVRVVDSRGVELCDGSDLSKGTCALTGTAPYRVLAHEHKYSGQSTGVYRVALHRTDGVSDCPVLPTGSFAADGAKAAFTLGNGVFSRCLSVPADAHTKTEVFQVTGSLQTRLSVLDATGKQVCGESGWTVCPLTPGLAHTVLITGDDSRNTYTVARRDVTADGVPAGCTSAAASEVGGPSVSRSYAGPGTLSCHQITTDAPTDVIHVRARDALGTVNTTVLGAEGGVECVAHQESCAVTGSTVHTVLSQVRATAKAAPEYRLDALRIATADGPSAACTRVPSVAYTYGPITSTLDERHTAVCAVLPTGHRDTLMLENADGSEAMTPSLYDRDTRHDGCTHWATGWLCSASASSTSGKSPTVLLLGLPEKASSTSLSVQLSCKYRPCGTDEVSVTGVSPTSAVGGGTATLTVTGTVIGPNTVVRLRRAGKTISAPVSWVAPDNRSASADLDLSGVEPGVWRLSVVTRGTDYWRGDFTVTQPTLTNTASPTITGTPKVGATVAVGTGTWSAVPASYAYRWTADGVPVGGASGASFVVPAELLGKRLGVTVTAARSGWVSGTADVVAGVVGTGDALKASKAPAIGGVVKVGAVVKAGAGVWSPAADSYRYQWTADGKAVPGATGASYSVPAALRGKRLGLTVTAARAGWATGTAASVAVPVALGDAPRATKAPVISGTAKVGRTLNAGAGVWSPAASSYAYQWYAGGTAIPGATKASLVLKNAQRGKRITVKVVARRAGHKDGVAVSAGTKAVVR